MKNREEINAIINAVITANIGNREWAQNIIAEMDKKHSIPPKISGKILSQWTNLSEYSDFIAYCFASSVKQAQGLITEEDEKQFANQKYQVEKAKFPLVFKCIQVDEDQWIGRTSVDELMQLRNAQLIVYDENAQRPLKKKTVNGEEIYTPAINNEAVEAIEESFDNFSFS